ncbi:MAG TPA: AbrB family transcriptional regulator [Ruminococcaceae bacterium]|nr:AbrB family transcriptional regulator [Oscillospiraceae bacterium]
MANTKLSDGKHAWTVKMGEKGQIVIPKEARDIFGFKPGDTLIILGDVKQGIAIPPQNMFTQVITAVFGGNPPKEDGEE